MVATRLDHALLALIGRAPRSGYDLRKIFALTPLAHFSDRGASSLARTTAPA
jgi:hypothetical protein